MISRVQFKQYKYGSKKTISKRAWLVVLSASLLIFYSNFQLIIFNSISNDIIRDFQITPFQMGWLSSIYFIGNFVFLFPAGLLLDRFSTKSLILMAMLIALSSMLGFAFSYDIIQAGFFRLMAGIAGAFCFVSAVRIASRWFSIDKLAFAIGWIVSIGMIGGLIAQVPSNYILSCLGWRKMLIASGIAGFFFLSWIAVFVKNWPKDKKGIQDKNKIHKLGLGKSIILVLKNKYNWLCGIYTGLINAPIYVLGALWGKLYLTKAHNVSPTDASYISSALFIGAIIGPPIVGFISNIIKRRKLPMLLGSVFSFITIVVIIYLPEKSFYTLLILFFLLGNFISTLALSFPTVTALNSPLLTASATSIISSILIASGFIFQPLFGYLLTEFIENIFVGKIPFLNFQKAMMIFPIAFILSFIISLFIKETYSHSKK